MAGRPGRGKRPARVSRADVVYERLRDEIIHGELADETQLSQVELAERFGVSRIPIREALNRLQAESLVVATPYHQFVVRNVTPDQVAELVEIRAALEDLGLARRGPLGEDELAELRDLNARLAEEEPGDAWFELDRSFHRVIAGPETMTVQLVDEVHDRVHRYISSHVVAKRERAVVTAEHAAIIDALAAGDVELARERLRDHVTRSRSAILGGSAQS
ncbi:MAG TPA: GntR family transcriptional regulator [Solirubrobacterales bacterium]|nr:GntR family transcriptional regulator [Solirubrobacterales bacterium]